MKIRTGFGYDVHQMEQGAEFWLGGVKIDHSKGASGHSDADVILHALCDALLGAANLDDIGTHFPNTDPEFKGKESTYFLKETMKMLAAKGWKFGNADITVCLEDPKIRPYVEDMKNTISSAMGTSPDNISIKATTSETMGFIGRKEGVEASCVVLIYEA